MSEIQNAFRSIAESTDESRDSLYAVLKPLGAVAGVGGSLAEMLYEAFSRWHNGREQMVTALHHVQQAAKDNIKNMMMGYGTASCNRRIDASRFQEAATTCEVLEQQIVMLAHAAGASKEHTEGVFAALNATIAY